MTFSPRSAIARRCTGKRPTTVSPSSPEHTAEFADVQMGVPGFEDEQCRAIAATVGDVRVIDLTSSTVRRSIRQFQYKLR